MSSPKFDCKFNVILTFREEFGQQIFDVELDIWPTEDKLLEIIFEESSIEELKLLHKISVCQYTDNDDDLLPFVKNWGGKMFFPPPEERIEWATDTWSGDDKVDEEYVKDLERWYNIKLKCEQDENTE